MIAAVRQAPDFEWMPVLLLVAVSTLVLICCVSTLFFAADAMPKYFFHIDGKRPHIDDVGVELKDDVSAWREGVRYLRHLEDQFEPSDDVRIEICRDKLPIYLLAVSSRLIRQNSEMKALEPTD